jgi:hypothetical protein
MREYFKFFAPSVCLGLVGCASVSVSSVSLNRHIAPSEGVSTVTVTPFTSLGESGPQDTQYLNPATGHLSWGSKKEKPQVGQLGQVTAKSMVRYLQQHGIAARISNQKPSNGLWVSGQFTQEAAGSRVLRTVVGLGAGQTKLEAKVHVYNVDKSHQPWISAWTSGGSNREPGAIFSAMPSPIPVFNIMAAAGTAISLVAHGQKGLTQDASRTGRTIGVLIKSESDKVLGRQTTGLPKVSGRVNYPTGGQSMRIPFSPRHRGHQETQFLPLR